MPDSEPDTDELSRQAAKDRYEQWLARDHKPELSNAERAELRAAERDTSTVKVQKPVGWGPLPTYSQHEGDAPVADTGAAEHPLATAAGARILDEEISGSPPPTEPGSSGLVAEPDTVSFQSNTIAVESGSGGLSPPSTHMTQQPHRPIAADQLSDSAAPWHHQSWNAGSDASQSRYQPAGLYEQSQPYSATGVPYNNAPQQPARPYDPYAGSQYQCSGNFIPGSHAASRHPSQGYGTEYQQWDTNSHWSAQQASQQVASRLDGYGSFNTQQAESAYYPPQSFSQYPQSGYPAQWDAYQPSFHSTGQSQPYSAYGAGYLTENYVPPRIEGDDRPEAQRRREGYDQTRPGNFGLLKSTWNLQGR